MVVTSFDYEKNAVDVVSSETLVTNDEGVQRTKAALDEFLFEPMSDEIRNRITDKMEEEWSDPIYNLNEGQRFNSVKVEGRSVPNFT